MNGAKRAYDFHKLVNTANTLNQLSAIENGLKFNKVHNKIENIWAKLYPLTEGQTACNLADYSQISSNAKVVVALQEGLVLAQCTFRGLSMAPIALEEKLE